MIRVNPNWASANRFSVTSGKCQRAVDGFRRSAAVAAAFGGNWYVVQVIAGMEFAVEVAMAESGIRVWLPRRLERVCCPARRGKGGVPRMRDVTCAAFPGYLFVRCMPSAEAWHGILSFAGVISILGEGDAPVLLHDKAMDDLVRMIERRVLDFSTGRNRFVAGDVVRFTHGQFVGFQGIVDETYGGMGMVPLLVDFMGRKAVVMAPVDSIEKDR